ncbi:hypothetical protein HA44_00490 [Mixta gaviniae]|nr:hypothetical protein HA44_00490 [Mixta gaviniae]
MGCNIIADFSLSEMDKRDSAARQRIDAIITDLSYCNDDRQLYGVAKIRAIQRALPEAKVVLYVEYDNLSILKKAISYGADAIVSKYDPVSEIKKALNEIFSRPHHRVYLSAFINAIVESETEKSVRLTAKEWEIIRLYSMGLSLSSIAKKQNRAVSTVATQKYNAMKKLNVNTNSELIQYACMNNII